MFSWESGDKASGLHPSPPYCKSELLPVSFHLFRKMIYPASPLWYKLPLLVHSIGAQRGGEGSSQNILGAFHQSPPFTHTLVWCVLVNSGGLMRKPHTTLVTNVHFDSCSRSAISTGPPKFRFYRRYSIHLPSLQIHHHLVCCPLLYTQCCDFIQPCNS